MLCVYMLGSAILQRTESHFPFFSLAPFCSPFFPLARSRLQLPTLSGHQPLNIPIPVKTPPLLNGSQDWGLQRSHRWPLLNEGGFLPDTKVVGLQREERGRGLEMVMKMFFIQRFLFFYIYINLLYYLLLAALGLHCCVGFLQLQREGATLHCGVRASHCGGFSCCAARALGAWASVIVARGLSSCGSRALERRLSSCGSQALERRLSSCGTWAQLLRGMWDLPGPGLEPVSPALAGRFLTTASPGKSYPAVYFYKPIDIPGHFTWKEQTTLNDMQ